MEWLRTLHGYGFNTPWAFLTPTPLALVTLVLFIWSLWVALRGEAGRTFTGWLRVTWAVFLLPALTGVLLSLAGGKVPSAVDIGAGKTKFGLPFDPTQEGMHWLYGGFALLTLYVIELLLRGTLVRREAGLRVLPVATLFLYGCAYMVGRVAIFPGSTPGQ